MGGHLDEIDWENYYESTSVKKGRIAKICCVCGKYIQVGHASHTHTFYPEFYAQHTHDNHPDHGDSLPIGQKSCTQIFNEELRKAH